MTKLAFRLLYLVFILILYAGCSSTVAPYTSVSFQAPPQLNYLSQSEVQAGDKLTISGAHFDTENPRNNKISITLSDGTKIPGLIDDVNEDEISFYVPIINNQSRNLEAQVSITVGEKNSSNSSALTLYMPEFSPGQLTLINNVRTNLASSITIGDAAQQLKRDIQTIVSENSDKASKQVDLSLAFAAQTPLEYMKVIKMLEVISVPEISSDDEEETSSFSDNSSLLNPFLENSSRSSRDSNSNISYRIQNEATELVCRDNLTTDEFLTETSSNNDLVIFYVNGMNTNLDEFRSAKERIREVAQKMNIAADVTGIYQTSIKDENIELLNFCAASLIPDKKAGRQLLAHQAEPTTCFDDGAQPGDIGCLTLDFFKKQVQFVGDLVNVAFEPIKQATNIASTCLLAPAVENFNEGAVDIFGDGTEALIQRIQIQRILGFEDACQVNQLVERLITLLNKNKRIIIVSHSQGNLYVTQALRELLMRVSGTQSFIGPIREPNRENHTFTKQQILNAIGVIWLASPVLIEDGAREQQDIPDLICSEEIPVPTCHPRYVGIRQDPVAHLRWINLGSVPGIIGGTFTEPTNIKIFASNAVETALKLSTMGFLNIEINKDSGVLVFPMLSGTAPQYNQSMYYSAIMPRDNLRVSVRNPETPNELLDFSIDHHHIEKSYFYDGPIQNKLSDGTKPLSVIEGFMTELKDSLVHPLRSNVELVIE